MSQRDDGGPAFPGKEAVYEGVHHGWQEKNRPGMSLRDYFAAQAMIALPHIGCGADLDQQDFAVAAYQYADAMLAQRSKP